VSKVCHRLAGRLSQMRGKGQLRTNRVEPWLAHCLGRVLQAGVNSLGARRTRAFCAARRAAG
jgi:hypothetical protein